MKNFKRGMLLILCGPMLAALNGCVEDARTGLTGVGRRGPHPTTKDWQMKSAVAVALSLLWSGMTLADAPNFWLVHVVGSDQPYICNECALTTPFPDPASAQALNAWKSGQAPFTGAVDEKGVHLSLKNGDKVTLCNQSGCSIYSWEEPIGWAHGVFQRQESH